MNISSLPEAFKNLDPGKAFDFKLPDWNIFEKLQSALDQLMEPIKAIGEFCNYILHPTQILLAFWNWTFNMSFYICLFAALGAVIMYACGFKKFGKFAPLAVVAYTFIQAIGCAFR